jgi:hypothetical protein
MSSFVNYFAPLAQDERMPIAREPVKNTVRNRRSIARVARRRAIERQRSEDAQVEHNESLTRNNLEDQAEDHPEEELLHLYPLAAVAVEAEAAAAEEEAQASHPLSHQVLLEEN